MYLLSVFLILFIKFNFIIVVHLMENNFYKNNQLSEDTNLDIIVSDNIITNNNILLYENLTISGNGMITINIMNISNYINNNGYGLLQVHSYQYNLTLSLKKFRQYRNYDDSFYLNGTNLGFPVFNDRKFFLYNYNQITDVNILIVLIIYKDKAPVPGGCTLEGTIDILPIINVKQLNGMLEVDTEEASINREKLRFPKYCSTQNLTYETRYKLLKKTNLTVTTYFDGIKSMLSYDDVIKNSLLSTTTPGPILRRLYNPISNNVFIFTTIVTSINNNNEDIPLELLSSVYVPAVVINSCSSIKKYDCDIFDDIGLIILSICLFFFGLFKILMSLNNISIKLITNGIEICGFLTWIVYQLLEIYSFNDGKSILLILFIFIFIIIWYYLMKFIKRDYYILIDLILKIILGYIISCYCFYFIGNTTFLTSNINYCLIFSTVTCCVIVSLIICLDCGIIVTTVLLGSFYSSIALQFLYKDDLFNSFYNNFKRIHIKNFNFSTDQHILDLSAIMQILFFSLLSIVGILYQHCHYYKLNNRINNVSTENTTLISRWINDSGTDDDVFESPRTNYHFFRQLSNKRKYQEI